jgi:hypothetical protein
MVRGRDNDGEEEGSVYQPSLQSGVGGSQSNEMDISYVDTNATSVEAIKRLCSRLSCRTMSRSGSIPPHKT